MELARPGVGYGVKDSRVESGRADRHPIKRARTTFTYLAVALSGSEAQRATYRRAVNQSHAQEYSSSQAFASKRVNKINARKEFFYATPEGF